MEKKKTKSANLESKRRVFFMIGLILATSCTLMAFEWKDYEKTENFELALSVDDFEEEIDNTYRDEPTPPKPKPIIKDEIVIVEDDHVIEEEFEIDIETDEEEEVEVEIVDIEEPEAPDVFLIVEDMPEFKGGREAMVKYIMSNLVYPEPAKVAEIEGKVYVEFVIDEKGKPTEIKLARGIHQLCDREALRVVKNMPAWKPGKQRGMPVKVRFTIELVFKLG